MELLELEEEELLELEEDELLLVLDEELVELDDAVESLPPTTTSSVQALKADVPISIRTAEITNTPRLSGPIVILENTPLIIWIIYVGY